MVVYSNLVDTFAALGDTTRMQILTQVAERPVTCSELVSQFNLSQQAVSKHIGVLREAGLITQEKQGRTRICQAVPRRLNDVLEWIEHRIASTKVNRTVNICYGSIAVIYDRSKTNNMQTTKYYM